MEVVDTRNNYNSNNDDGDNNDDDFDNRKVNSRRPTIAGAEGNDVAIAYEVNAVYVEDDFGKGRGRSNRGMPQALILIQNGSKGTSGSVLYR